jgi:predicted Fe-Mo cluster-binding NifX family protein
MKIAIPLANGRLSMHFGHCEQFALVEVDEQGSVGGVERLAAPAHEPGALPRWLHEMGVDVIVAGGMGRRAQQIFADKGIEVVVGAPPEAPESLATAYVNGTLAAGANLCDH